MSSILSLIKLGNPILRAVAKEVPIKNIQRPDIQTLIANICYTNSVKQYGVGLVAPQVGVSLALSVIGIKPTPTRPKLQPFEAVIINPSYQGIGRKSQMWEGCQSVGSGNDTLYGLVPRYKKIIATWYDEKAVFHKKELTGFVAHVFQHETDHLGGVIFIDKVKNTKSYMMASEYRKKMKVNNSPE